MIRDMEILKQIDYDEMKLIKKNQNTKQSTFIGKIDDKDIIISINPTTINHIDSKNIINNISENTSSIKVLVSNERYYKYTIEQINKIDFTVVYPALECDILKYCKDNRGLYIETYDDYLKNIYPNIGKPVVWIDNILNHKFEHDLILYEDEDYVLMPDMKWNRINIDEMYCLAIVKDRSLMSIRNLSGKDISLLEKIRDITLKVINEKYAIPKYKVKAYFHYPPSFYHLHIHFNMINYVQFGASCVAGHSLTSVISNLKILSDYYQRVDIEKWYVVEN
jgi:m7GpppX diphosphatase